MPARARILAAVTALARNPAGRRLVSAVEIRALASMLHRSNELGPEGRALGALFARYEPNRSARQIYHDVFSPRRFALGYRSQMAQDLFLNRWIFKNGGPGFFLDVGAFDGELGSNTCYFEKQLGWTGIAFEPNPSAFSTLQQTRACQAIQGCAYNRDGEVSFLALSDQSQQQRVKLGQPANLCSLVLDPSHGAVMLSGIDAHIENRARLAQARHAWNLNQALVTVRSYRIDTVLANAGVSTVDYLTIDVEGAELEVLQGIDFRRVKVNVVGVERNERFPAVYDLLTAAGFEYQGLLFFDEIFVNRELRFSWNAPAPPDLRR